ncbi:MAG: sigma-70 family RNA polymerase sigma factor [Desulfobacterales bacterium]|nr:sigma-70 family RNA polymerase sigma factor [Desulfobacterales bacterium]
MKRLTTEEERRLLHECLCLGRKDRLVKQYWKLVQSTVEKILKKYGCCTEDDTASLRNDVFVRLLERNCQRLRQYEEKKGRGLAGWIYLITVQTVIRSLDKKGPDSISSQDRRVSFVEEIYNSGGRSFRNIEAADRLIEENLKKLPSKDQLILKLYLYRDLSAEDIASYMNMNVNACNTARSRAFARLRELITEDKYFGIIEETRF